MRPRLTSGLIGLCALAAAFALPASAEADTQTFNYSGGVQTWIVPQGVKSATFDIYGASGSADFGGKGGRATASFSVVPGQTYGIYVGGAGNYSSPGWNGGGLGSYSGGGGTDVRLGGSALANRILVAGGGGGMDPSGSNGGSGGGLVGTAGAGGFGGAPGTQSAGGAGTFPGWDGSLGQGGGGTPGALYGGGGGGYYGGGSYGNTGGGGSGYGPPSTAFETGVRSGNGQATVTYQVLHRAVTTIVGANGAVDSSPAGIDCAGGSVCSYDFIEDSEVSLTATPYSGYRFDRWDGACSAETTNTCTLDMSADKIVNAYFKVAPKRLTVSKRGGGSGTVESAPGGINCGTATCSIEVNPGTSVFLEPTPATGSDFAGWSGAGCSGTSSCLITVNQDRDIEATFVLEKRTLSVSKSGTGAGRISSAPSGIDCGLTCSSQTFDFEYGSSVSLTAAPSATSDFGSWTAGPCAGSTNPVCTTTMDQARSAQAGFTLKERSLTVTRSANGTGTVTSSPAGINCGSTCSSSYADDTQVTLTASPGPGSTFDGWSGACSGTSATCVVTMDQARSVDAAFPLSKRVLSVTRAGGGSGAVSSSPSGIDCGSACSAAFDDGTAVTLTPAPASGSSFAGWSGACTGRGACTVTMDQARGVEATFVKQRHTLSVTETGAGAISSDPGPIDCGSTCSADYDAGSQVTLTATPEPGSEFAGWNGACSGTDAHCTVTMDQERSVGAVFTRLRALTVSRIGAGSGTVVSRQAGIDCGDTCTADYADGTDVTLIAAPADGSDFKAWSGACSGQSITCTVSMTQARTAIATFADSAPEVTLTDTPPRSIKLRGSKNRAKVTIAFTSSQPGTFACVVDGKSPRACGSPLVLRLKPGRHTIEIRAINARGTESASPAVARVRVKP